MNKMPTRAHIAAVEAGQTERLCAKCNRSLQLDRFHCFRNHCKECMANQSQLWRRAQATQKRTQAAQSGNVKDLQRLIQVSYTELLRVKAAIPKMPAGTPLLLMHYDLELQNPHFKKLYDEVVELYAAHMKSLEVEAKQAVVEFVPQETTKEQAYADLMASLGTDQAAFKAKLAKWQQLTAPTQSLPPLTAV